MADENILLCTFINDDQQKSDQPPPLFTKKCCQACAWREEQLRHTKELKSKSESSERERLLQTVADKILPPPSMDHHSDEGLVQEVKRPLTEREIQYGTILSHAIKCKTVSYDEPHLNEDSKGEFIKLHQLLKTSFPTIYEKYPPQIVNDFSLIFRISSEGKNKEKKPMMLCAHLDVVPADFGESNDQWAHQPFSGDIVNGIVWGRGGKSLFVQIRFPSRDFTYCIKNDFLFCGYSY
jgi:hypothetical protein